MGRIPTGKVPEQQLQHLRPVHREIMRRLVCGEKSVRIADDLRMSQSRLSIILNSPLFMAELGKLERDVTENVVDNLSEVDSRLRVLAPNAVEVINGIMIAKLTPSPLRRACARDILDLVKQSSRDIEERRRSDTGVWDLGEIISSAWAAGEAAKEEGQREARKDLEEIIAKSKTTDVDPDDYEEVEVGPDLEVEEVKYLPAPPMHAKAVNE